MCFDQRLLACTLGAGAGYICLNCFLACLRRRNLHRGLVDSRRRPVDARIQELALVAIALEGGFNSRLRLRDQRKVIAAVQLNEQVALARGLIALTRTTRTGLATSALRGVRPPRTHASFCGLLDAITMMAIAGSKATSGGQVIARWI